ncbi:MAG: MFS transporter [Candidatus Dormibacteraeota bacterium]|nr:MFS transporter [Candidatus Dormibacteraeota bacterium]
MLEHLGGRRRQLWLAAAGLFLAALDTYAVVTLLPQMLAAVEVPVDRLEAAAPILTGFLGGYVVAMPLLGAFSDARGRLPAYAVAVAVFALGSTLTALAPALGWLVAGRVLQGLGGGALVPLTLALAADIYPAGRRTLPLGAVGAVQEAGSVLGPVYGAALAAALGSWRAVFWLNLPLGALVVLGLWAAHRREAPETAARAPGPPNGSQTVDRSVAGRAQVDWASASLLGLGLALLVFALYPDDPQQRAVNSLAAPLSVAGLLLLGAFAWRQARRLSPLIPPQLLRSRAFAGSLGANLIAGAGLMVALVDVPVLARGVFDLDTLHSGLLLVRLLLGLPVGALIGGWLGGRIGRRWTAAGGLTLAAAAFALMSGWGVNELVAAAVPATLELFMCGLGFGIVIAPLSAAVLDLAPAGQHGLASSLVVLARTLGMVIGLASLTAFGLSRFQRIFIDRHCDAISSSGGLRAQLNAFENCVRGALLQEYREVFLVAAGLCALGALLAAATLGSRRRETRAEPRTAAQA